MKEKDGFIDYPDQQMILYVEKEDGKYGPMQTGSYLSANYMDDYNLKRRNLETRLREQLCSGEISVIRYFMVLEDLTISELAARSGIWKYRVRKHLEPAGFQKATMDEAKRYARVFNVETADLLEIILTEHEGIIMPHTMLDKRLGPGPVKRVATANPMVVITTFDSNPK